MRTPFDDQHPVTYAEAEAEAIRQSILTEGASLDCPLCGQRLVAGGRAGRVSHVEMWELHCEPCRRFIVVEDSLHL